MIRIKNLTFGYGFGHLFEGIDVDFLPGRIYGFLGKNGAGKTSLFKIMSGLLMPGDGTCDVLDFRSSSRHPGLLQDLFLIPEAFYLPAMSIGRYLKLHAPFYPRFDYAGFESMLDELELRPDLAINTLSYGLKKRFLLAFGLASNCRILLLDEPTNGLDIPSKRILRKMLAAAVDESRTFIIATHQIKEIENIFDSLVFIDQGKILLDTTIENVSRRLKFHTVSFLEECQGCLYSEEVPGGYSVISRNDSEEEGKIDIEFLFNAVTDRQSDIAQVLGDSPMPGGNHE
ncbi:MAG: ABC transporter ATP-binding protein [Proteobacteria bacterium]|nr:ABC transporter ATP-binding protein [Pseudomonadota bacterium]